MIFYLAAKYEEKYKIRMIRDHLEALGHEVTSSWLKETEEPSVQIHEVHAVTLAGYAVQDIADIGVSEAVVHFRDKDSPNLRGGAIKESGIGIGMGKLSVLVGDKVDIFDFLPETLVFDTVDKFLAWAEKLNEPKEYAGIAVSGKARGGKDYSANVLSNATGWPVSHFADELKLEWFKKMHCNEYATGKVSCYDVVAEVNRMKMEDPGIRQQLIDHGMWRREQDPNYWVSRINYDRKNIVADVRFKNEFYYLKERGYFMLRIESSSEVREARGQADIDDLSETDLDDMNGWDAVIENNGTKDAFRYRIGKVAEEIKEGG